MVRRRLSSGASPTSGKAGMHFGNPEAIDPATAATSEVSKHPAHAPDSSAELFHDRPGISIADVVDWQLKNHPGFVASFISSIRHAPITGQHDRWRVIGDRLSEQRSTGNIDGLNEGRVLILLGRTDGVIVADEIASDAAETLGQKNAKIVVLEGGHDVPVVNSVSCVGAMTEFWNEALKV